MKKQKAGGLGCLLQIIPTGRVVTSEKLSPRKVKKVLSGNLRGLTFADLRRIVEAAKRASAEERWKLQR